MYVVGSWPELGECLSRVSDSPIEMESVDTLKSGLMLRLAFLLAVSHSDEDGMSQRNDRYLSYDFPGLRFLTPSP